MATYPTILAGQRATAVLLTSMQPLIVAKTSDETVNNSATHQNDNELVLAVSAGATYLLDMLLIYQSASGADLSLKWSVPSGTTMRWGALGIDTATVSNVGDWSAISRTESDQAGVGGNGTSSPLVATPRGIVYVSSTAGNLQFQWAQSVATVSNTQVLSGSWLRLTRYA